MRGGSRAEHPLPNPKGLGRHLVVELCGCDSDILRDSNFILDVLTEAAHSSGAEVVGRYSERFGGGGGVSAIVVIKESHISIHTWPELGYASLDIFTCGEHVNPWKAYGLIIEKLKPTGVGAIEIIRGLNVSLNMSVNLQVQAGKRRGG
ncbi:MAG: adenosylmethionine decarboxylase [Nitrososphaerota archaeon]|nr:adenosylmethionine decarboxylase [Candidatus Calditenuaceae archaeon]MDW8073042.1 adenosylmethionine decarboxylase [Nitrososphaerota archaeon]